MTKNADFKEFNFPLTFEFKLGTLSNDFIAKDANGQIVAYVRQKMFRLKEAIMVYADEHKTNLKYTINANKIIDFSASYEFLNNNNQLVGSVGRKGMKSLWKAHYDVFDTEKSKEFTIKEENPWAKVMDTLMSEIPIVGIFTGYAFNPKYGILDNSGKTVARLSKEKSFFGRKFKLEKLENLKEGDSERILLGLMMMVLLERRRG
ncbi:MAG: hypothetical protein HYR91_10110 [Flavobacteriia bacterium]|nr:hypothetical protein [Flavobacteriia bacterium]